MTGQGTLSGLCPDDSHRLQKRAPLVTLSPLPFIPSGPTCKGAAELLEVSQDLLAQEVDETGDNLRDKEGDNHQSWWGSLSQRHINTPEQDQNQQPMCFFGCHHHQYPSLGTSVKNIPLGHQPFFPASSHHCLNSLI